MTVATINEFNPTNEVHRMLHKQTGAYGYFTPNEPLRILYAESPRTNWPMVNNGPGVAQDQISAELSAWEAASDEVWNSLDDIAD